MVNNISHNLFTPISRFIYYVLKINIHIQLTYKNYDIYHLKRSMVRSYALL